MMREMPNTCSCQSKGPDRFLFEALVGPRTKRPFLLSLLFSFLSGSLSLLRPTPPAFFSFFPLSLALGDLCSRARRLNAREAAAVGEGDWDCSKLESRPFGLYDPGDR